MKRVRVFPKPIPQERKRAVNQANQYVFCEKSTGVAQFRAGSSADFDLTVERIAGLLAMQCLVRGQNPDDFEVLVPAERSLVGSVISRAQELLNEGRAAACPASLSLRQREILHSVICNKANKEIASKLNITVRTVKFHVSSLLNKFGVQNRAELAQRAAGYLRPPVLREEDAILERPLPSDRRRALRTITLDLPLQIAGKERAIRFPSRILLA
ncbi:MAG: helix-turn-helix transcriptional regulator [Candidatus Acidiferrales bacterium]